MLSAISQPSLKIALKFERLNIPGANIYQNLIADILVQFEIKKNWPKNKNFESLKLGTLEAPWYLL